MDKLATWLMTIGGIIFVLAGCALDSVGTYGYIAGAAAIAGGGIAGFGYGLHILARKRKEREIELYHFQQRKNEDIIWIEEVR